MIKKAKPDRIIYCELYRPSTIVGGCATPRCKEKKQCLYKKDPVRYMTEHYKWTEKVLKR